MLNQIHLISSWLMIVCRLIFTYKQYTKDITIMKGVQMEARSNMNKKLTPDFELQPSKIPCETFQVVKRLLRETMIEKQNIVKISRASGFFINPSTVKISIWNFIVIFTAYFLEFEISLTLAFGPQFWQTQIVQSVYLYWYILLLLLLLIDILVNFNKGFYAFGQGTIIDDKKEIIKKYIGSYFILDSICFGILLIPLIYNELILNYLQLVPVILLIIKKFKCQAEITRNLQYHYMGRVVFTLGMLGCDVLLLGNFGACIFLGIDLLLWKLQYFQSNPQYFWLSNNSMTSNNLMEPPFNSRIVQYVYAQCYSTGTLSTLAPGPFGKNVIEISLQLFIMTYFMILASYVAEVLILTFYSKQMVRIFHDNNINKFDHFLALKGVLFETKKRIHGFFQLIWEYQVKNQTTLQKAAINKLPLTIRQTLLYQMCFANQLKFPRIYSLEIEREIQKIVSFKIKTYIVDPDTTLFQNGTLTDSQGEAFIYNVKNGLAKYYLPFGKKNKTICLSNLRKIMGQYEFMTGLSHAYCAKSIDLSVVQKISFSDLNAILKSFNLQEQYFIVRFRIMLYNEVDLIERRCLICNEKHRQNCCTLIYPHYQIEQKFNKKQKKLEEQQERSPYERNQKYFRPRIPSKVESELHKITMKKIKIISSHKVNRQNLNKISDRVNIFQKFYTQYNLID